jgi:hypothetical protein
MKDEKEGEDKLIDNIPNQTRSVINQIQNQMKITEESLDDSNKIDLEKNQISKSMFLPKIKSENRNIIQIKDSSLEFVKLEDNFSQKPLDAPFDDCCSLCSSKIYYVKYICVICHDCILCPKCEIDHEHPTVKCKFPHISTLRDIYNYINTRNTLIKNNKNFSGFISDIFSSKNELKLECNSSEFSMRKKQVRNIPIILHNLSGNVFDLKKNNVVLFARNNKDLKVYTKFLEDKMNKNETKKILMKLESNDIYKVYNFTIEAFCLNKMKSNILNFKVEINENEEDEKLNEFFIESYPDFFEILIETTSIKKGVRKILESTKNEFDIGLILKSIKNNKGNIDDAFFDLFNKRNK